MALKSNISIIVKLHSTSEKTFIANCIGCQWKTPDNSTVKHAAWWYFMYIPEVGYRWLPESYLIAWAV